MILIDDDHLIHDIWKMQVKQDAKLTCFDSVESFLTVSQKHHKDSFVFIDSSLGYGLKGEEESFKIFNEGFKRIVLTTGSNLFLKKPWILTTIGKKFPGIEYLVNVLKKDEIEILNATESEYNEVVDCINTTFCSSEPTSKAINLSKNEFKRYVEIFAKRSIGNNETTIIRVKGEIAACIISERVLQSPDGLNEVSKKLDPVMAILGDLDDLFFNESSLSHKDCFHILMVGVLPKFKGLKLAEQIIIYQEAMAKFYGYKYIFAEATGPVSQYIFKKLGYTIAASIDYKTYCHNQLYPFNSIEDCDSCALVLKKL